MTAMPTSPAYKALTGPELKAVILRRIEDALDATGKFPAHLSYPNVQMAFVVNVRLPLMTDRNFEVRAVVEDSMLDADTPAETVAVSGELVETAERPADAIRHDHDLPVTAQTITPGGLYPKITEREMPPPKKGARK